MIKTHNENCESGLLKILDNSVDVILTDPPWKYLKNQKLEIDFNEEIVFNHFHRILKDNGFIVLFGRGTSFYRWNFMLTNLGFIFKEEIIWNKSYSSSPVLPISRTHESISIHTKKTGKINKVKIQYLEQKGHNINSVIDDINRLKTALKNPPELLELEQFFKAGIRTDFHVSKSYSNHKTTLGSDRLGKRLFSCANSIKNGMNEKSIIKLIRDHYSTIHPTQKPVRLLERLINLTTKRKSLIIDPFAGSFSAGIAAFNLGHDFIGYELDEEYFEKGTNYLKENTQQQLIIY